MHRQTTVVQVPSYGVINVLSLSLSLSAVGAALWSPYLNDKENEDPEVLHRRREWQYAKRYGNGQRIR
jgi:hypothetical protein